MKTEYLGYSNVHAITDVPIEVTDGRLVIDARGSFGSLSIVPADKPVKALATATVRTHSIPHMIGVMRDTGKPPADRLAALYSLGDMAEAAAPAVPAIAEILLETEQDKGAKHWVAAWAVWRTGLEHVPASRRTAVEKILAGLADHEPNKGYWPAVGIGVRRPAGGR